MIKIVGIDLYRDQTQASDEAQKALDALGVKYNVLFYHSETHNHELVYAPLRTWNFKEGPLNTTMPFVTFLEQTEDEDPRKWPVHFLAASDFSKLSDWLK